MQPLWKVLNFTSEFKHHGDIWVVMHDGDTDDSVVVRNQRTQHITPFNLYCLVEPCGIDMG